MEVKTKFSVGEKVFSFDKNHKLIEFEIAKIFVALDDDNVLVTYYPDDGHGGCNYLESYNEAFCFASEADAVTYVKG